jgi:RecB family exonuclease
MQCPRRYAFERRLRVDAGGSVYQELGSLIHAALERAETSAAHNGEPHATANMAVEELDELFDPAVFGGGAWAEAWRTRAHDIVTRLYELWPGSGAGEEFEFTFDLTLDGTRWVGKIDRIESREDGLHIVDYKTGTTVPTTATAASSLQLGLYFLGLNEHDDRPVAGAEFWYPAHNREKAKSVTVRRLDPVELDTVKSRLSEAADGITSERWEPVVGGHCERCPVRIVCPEWPEGREAYVS